MIVKPRLRKLHVALGLFLFFLLFPTTTFAFYYQTLVSYTDTSSNYLSTHYQAKVLHDYPFVRVASVYASISEINKMKKDAHIVSVAFDNSSTVSLPAVNNFSANPYSENENAYSLIRLQEAHKSGMTGKNTSVCIVDSGIDSKVDAFVQKNITAKSFITEPNGTYNTMDYNGHGTHVAGLVAGKSKTGVFTGVAPDANLYVAKIYNKAGGTSNKSFVAAINWCVSKKVNVINMSIAFGGGPSPEPTIDYIFKNAYQAGSIPVAAVGNDGIDDKRMDNVRYPARSSYVLGAASVNDIGGISSYSNRGPSVFAVAPGEFMYSAYPYNLDTEDTYMGDSQNGYTYLSGTSMAAPIVSGVLALAKEKSPFLSNAKIINIVKSSSIDKGTPGRDRIYGCGVIQAYPLDSSLAQKAPSPPKITSYIFNKGTLTVKWKAPLDCDLYGFNVLIDGKKVNNSYLKSPIIYTKYIVYGKPFKITVQAVDNLGNISTSQPVVVPPLSKDTNTLSNFFKTSSYTLQQKWMTNFKDYTFRPANVVSRAEGAVTLNRVINLSKVKSTSYYRDVAKTHWAYQAISKVTNARLMYGSKAGNFGPSNPMNRAEMAVLLQRLLKVKSVPEKSPFKDVQNKKQYGYQAIITMNHYGYFKGCSTTYFCPTKSLTRAELASTLKVTGKLIKQRN